MKHSYIIILMAALLLTACRSSKNATRTPVNKGNTTATTHIDRAEAAAAIESVRKVAARQLSAQGITANTKVRLTGVGGKDLSVNGKLQMLRNKVIRLSLRFLGMEVGLMEFTPTEVLVIDRMNKQYVRAAYADVSFLQQANLDFYSLQALFWNELFLPGKHQLTASDFQRFKVTQQANLTLLQPKDTPKLNYVFSINPTASTIQRLQVKSLRADERGEFAFNYNAFEAFGGRPFPTALQMAVTGTGKKDVALALNLSSLKAATNIEPKTNVSAKYTQRSVREVLGKLGL